MPKHSKDKKKKVRKRHKKQAQEKKVEKHISVKAIVQEALKKANHYDVIIIGAGPAGATCLKFLTDEGMNGLALERASPDREKPCGGGVPPRVLKDFPFIKDLVAHTTTIIEYIYGDQSKKKEMKVHMVRRVDFDNKLREIATESGPRIWYNTKGLEINPLAKIVKVTDEEGIEHSLTYEWLIGAGGIACPVARLINFEKDLCPLEVGVADMSEEEQDDTSKIYWFPKKEGYLWVFPKGGFANVGFGGKMPMREVVAHLDKFCEEHGLELRDRKKWMIPINVTLDQLPYDEEKNIILVGDSASFVNPMTGEGIYFAMKSGIEAAEIICEYRDFESYPSFIERLYHLMGLKHTAMVDMDDGFSLLVSDTEISDKVSEYVFMDGENEEPDLDPLSDKEKLDIFNSFIDEFEEESD